MNRAQILAEYVQKHPLFKIVPSVEECYGHMGATLTDAVLQAGVKYETVVRPRVQHLLKNYPQAKTTTGFHRLLQESGAPVVLRWAGGRKLETMNGLLRLLIANGVETEDDFRSWIGVPGNLDTLRRIKGIKDKTAHYLEILLGKQSVAVDRHLFHFLTEAGVPTNNYDDAHALITEAACILDVEASRLDHSIWRYMSERTACP